MSGCQKVKKAVSAGDREVESRPSTQGIWKEIPTQMEERWKIKLQIIILSRPKLSAGHEMTSRRRADCACWREGGAAE